MKKILALLLVAVMCLLLVACGNRTMPNIGDNSDEQLNQAQPEGGNNENADAVTQDTELQYETVELTLENWDQYFEIADKLEIARDEFGEIWRIQIGYYFQLKPEYSEKYLDLDGFAAKIEFTTALIDGKVNVEEETYEITQDLSTGTSILWRSHTVNRIGSFYSSVYDRRVGIERFTHFPYDFKVTQIKGLLFVEQ